VTTSTAFSSRGLASISACSTRSPEDRPSKHELLVGR
jgi:hypothetical protein